MKLALFFITALFFTTTSNAQQFIDKAVIEYEVNTNLKKTMGDNSWAEMIKENISDLKTSYFTYSFENNKSIYKFDRWSPKTRVPSYYKGADEEKNSWYFDFTTNKMNMQKQIMGTNFVIVDSIPNIQWKITNENREIAGFNCRKAVGKIMDDVYIFAFYTDEITISGPCSINGLPGMILGLTIPRLYTSFVATKVNINSSNPSEIKPITAKKTYNMVEMKSLIEEKTKDWFSYGEDKEENKRQKQVFMLNSFL